MTLRGAEGRGAGMGMGSSTFWWLKTAWLWPGCLFWGRLCRTTCGFFMVFAMFFFDLRLHVLARKPHMCQSQPDRSQETTVIFSPRIAKPCVAENHGGKHDLRQNCSSIIAEMVRNKANLNVRSAAGCRCSIDKANLGVKASFRLQNHHF